MRNRSHSPFRAAALCAGYALVLAAPPSIAQNTLFPTRPGNAWTYTGTLPQGKGEMTASVLSVKRLGAKETVVLQWAVGDQPFQDEYYEVSSGEVARARSGVYGTNRISPAIPIVRSPMSVGKTWSWKGKFKVGDISMDASCTMKAAALEDVTTKAGKFQAYRVEFALTLQDKTAKKVLPSTYWFAPGVGVVRQKTQLMDGKSVELSLVKRNFK